MVVLSIEITMSVTLSVGNLNSIFAQQSSESKPVMPTENELIFYDDFEDGTVGAWQGYTSVEPYTLEPYITAENVKSGKFAILVESKKSTCNIKRQVDFVEDNSLLSFRYYLEPYSYAPEVPNQIQICASSETEGKAWYALLIPCTVGRWTETRVKLTRLAYNLGGTEPRNGLSNDRISLIFIGAAFDGAKLIIDDVKLENRTGDVEKTGEKESISLDMKKMWGQFNIGAGTTEPDHMGHIPYLYWFGELYFFSEMPFDSLFANGWKLAPTGGGNIYGIGFKWPRPLAEGYKYEFYISFESFPDLIVIDNDKVWNYEDGEIKGNYAVIPYVPSGKGEGMFWCIRNKNSPLGRMPLVFSQNYSEMIAGSLAFCLRQPSEKGELQKYEAWNPPYRVWQSEKVYSRFHYLRNMPVKYDKQALQEPPYPTDEVIFLERDAWWGKLPEFCKVLSDSGINGLIGHSLDITAENAVNIYNRRNFEKYMYHFDSIGIHCASPMQWLIRPGEGWGPGEEGAIQRWYKNSIQAANIVTEEIPDSKAYIFYAEDDSPQVLFNKEYTEYKTENIFVRLKKMFEIYAEWKQKIWSELKNPESCFLLNMSGNPLYPSAYVYKNGADIAAYKNTYRMNTELTISNARGGARAYKKKFGSNYDFWSGAYQSTHSPEEFEQILHLYYSSGADFISPEEYRFWYDETGKREGGPNRFGEIYLDSARFMKTHPGRGEQMVKIGIVRGFGDTWTWIPSEVTGDENGSHNTQIRQTLPLRGESERAYPYDAWYQEVLFSQLDYNLLTVFFPDYGNYRKTNLERFCTGTPYGPVDMLPWDTPLSHLKTFDILIYMGINAMDSDQWNNIREYVKNGGKLVIAEGQLLKEGDDPRELFNGNLETFFGIRMLTQDNIPSSVDKEEDIMFKIDDTHFKGKVKSYYRIEPAGCEVIAQTVNGDPVVTRTRMKDTKGEVYFYATRYISCVSEEVNLRFLEQLLKDTDVKILEFSPETSWLEYTVQKKKDICIISLFNHGRIKFPSGTGKDRGIWKGKLTINLNKLDESSDDLEAFIVNPENFDLTPARIKTIEENKAFINVKIDKRMELIIGPTGKAKEQFFVGE